jgi:hypothetical protein
MLFNDYSEPQQRGFSETHGPEPSTVGIIIPPTVPGTQIGTGPTFPERRKECSVADPGLFPIPHSGTRISIQGSTTTKKRREKSINYLFYLFLAVANFFK